MDIENDTRVTMFEFSGLTDNEALVPFLFALFFSVYAVTIILNVSMLTLVYTQPSLHIPMYYLLSGLALVDILYSSVVNPKLLFDLLSSKKYISFTGCALQFYFFSAFGSTEAVLFSCMSYDRYVAICQPLHYTMNMTKRKCLGLVVYSFLLCFLQSVVQTCCVFSLRFCGPNLIEHFYCDLPPLLRLPCSGTFQCEMTSAVLVAVFALYTMMTILLSYVFIFSAILKMRSSRSREKAFSTCSSHIICVSVFIASVLIVYVRPLFNVYEKQDMLASLLYIVVTPLLNPLVYSLRNQEVKRNVLQAIKKCCR